uniref:Uncharacterized protein n=1 Tax=Theropithecus gelada TaxID=9565 RepID=A0A8D2EN01_THEGE
TQDSFYFHHHGAYPVVEFSGSDLYRLLRWILGLWACREITRCSGRELRWWHPPPLLLRLCPLTLLLRLCPSLCCSGCSSFCWSSSFSWSLWSEGVGLLPSSSLFKATYFCGAFFFLALLKLFSFLRRLGSLLRASGHRLREGLLLPCLVGVGWWLLFNNCTGGSQFSLHLQQVNLSQGSHVAAFLPEATGPGVPVPVSGESTSAQQSHAGWQLSAEAEACPSVLYSEVLEWNKNINTYTSFHGFCLILGIVLFCFGGDRLTLH